MAVAVAVVEVVVGALLASSACLVIYRCRLKRCGSLLLQLCCLNRGRVLFVSVQISTAAPAPNIQYT